jgi:protein ImuA
MTPTPPDNSPHDSPASAPLGLPQLRAQLAALKQGWQQDAPTHDVEKITPIPLGVEAIDAALGGGLMPGALHEAWAPGTSDMAALGGFAAGLLHGVQAALNRPVVWVRQTAAEAETGLLYAPGLVGIGLDPDRLIAVRTRTLPQLLGAGLEAVRCNAVSAVVIEAWDPDGAIDLTATRRLALASETSGTLGLILRICHHPPPSAALTRWRIGACPSQGFAAGAPGYAAFDITLQRNRNGRTGQRWRVEWNHDDRYFQQTEPITQTAHLQPPKPVSRAGVPVPQRGPAEMAEDARARPRREETPRRTA